jgi:hypothetical protein
VSEGKGTCWSAGRGGPVMRGGPWYFDGKRDRQGKVREVDDSLGDALVAVIPGEEGVVHRGRNKNGHTQARANTHAGNRRRSWMSTRTID